MGVAHGEGELGREGKKKGELVFFFHAAISPHPTHSLSQSTTPSIDSEPYHMAFTGLTLADTPKPPHGLAPLRTSRRRRGRRGTLDGGGDVGESSDDAAVSVSPAW